MSNTPDKLNALALAAALSLPFGLASIPVTSAHAQTATQSGYAEPGTAPRVSSVGVQAVRAIKPGTRLDFDVRATPDSDVSIQIEGATLALPLSEVDTGVYQGSYTVRSRDRIGSASIVTAKVTRAGFSDIARLDRSLVVGAAAPVPAPSIASFTVDAPERARPGDELAFRVTGTPGATARVSIAGASHPVTLTEVRSGVYEGTYVLRRGEGSRGAALKADATLLKGTRQVAQAWQQPYRPGGPTAGNDDRRGYQPVACVACGRVESVERVKIDKGSDRNNVLGTIIGGVVGGVAGNQVGDGRGKDAARVIGAIGGAYAGNRIQNRVNTDEVWRVTVRLEGGTLQSFDYALDPEVAIGTRVRVESGQLVRLG